MDKYDAANKERLALAGQIRTTIFSCLDKERVNPFQLFQMIREKLPNSDDDLIREVLWREMANRTIELTPDRYFQKRETNTL